MSNPFDIRNWPTGQEVMAERDELRGQVERDLAEMTELAEARDAARGIATELEQRLAAIVALHQHGTEGHKCRAGHWENDTPRKGIRTFVEDDCPTLAAAAGGGLGV